MDFADIALCQQLFELSGWEDTSFKYDEDGKTVMSAAEMADGEGTPAYDLGYLVRKLPYSVSVTALRAGFTTTAAPMRHRPPHFHYLARGDTPEDTTADVLIEMFKQGVLKRGEVTK
jgi:hypothetical protein